MPTAPTSRPTEAPLTWKQRLRRGVYRHAFDRLRGRAGVRVLRLPGRSRRVIVLTETVEALRDLRPSPAGTTRRLTVLVGWWRAPLPGWVGRVAPVRGCVRQRVSVPRRQAGLSRVDITVSTRRSVGELIAAATPALRPDHPLPEIRALPTDGAASVAVAAPARILVDATLTNPRGRRFDSFRGDAPCYTLAFSGGGSGRLVSPWRYGSGGELPWASVAALRSVGVVSCPRMPGRDPAAEAALLVRLAMTGALVHAPEVAGDRLHPALRAVLAEPVPNGELAREERSVRQRREAIRRHSTYFGAGATPSVSVIIATRRAEHVASIVAAMAGQTYPNLELVVCLHGLAPSPVMLDLLAACGRAYQVISVPERTSFGAVLGEATARAQGTLLAKVDDDDSYGSEHIWDLVVARHYSGATMIGKGAEFVYLEDAGITVRRWSGRPEADDSFVAGGTILIDRAELVDLGGWRPVPRAVDRALLDRLTRAGGTVYRTHALGYLYHRRAQGHTWDPGQEYFLRGTRARWDGPHLPDPGPAAVLPASRQGR